MSALEVARLALLVGHLLGLAAIIGSFLLQLRRASGIQFGLIMIGAVVQLLTGFALVGVRRASDLDVIGPKIGVKIGIALIVFIAAAAALILQRRRRAAGSGDEPLRPLLYTAGIAAIADVVVAVFWR
ncbi:hypothetical protein [Microbacterium ulmi]|uniref:Integral membrane protein n=1 Tax=Microbacterium ulmi TaxID=179095 RepID=A0A7Y2M038_9MICO|nr:hypothetical protein [Microbacterium ulmi]NII71354.1 hypothetical protein [Microbacterium ulmi]NNH02658.1 hypothetical protein [Microbacterium ulmi]